MPTAICLGILVADVIGRPIESAPARGALELVESITPHIGGCAANTGIGLGKLGVATAVAGKVGRDGFGAFVRDELQKHGVQTQIAEDSSAPTSATMVMVAPDGERSFLHCTGANAKLVATDFSFDPFPDAQLLHIAGHGLMPAFDGAGCAEVLREAKSRGLRTCLDTAGSPTPNWPELLGPCLAHLDFLVPSFHEARHCVPAEFSDSPASVAEFFIGQGVEVVALKMGEAGSYLRTREGLEATIPALKVPTVDATGAGDAFAAGFLAGILRGLPLEECARLGNATGACCVGAVGTVAGLKGWDETLAMARNIGVDE